MKRKKVVVFLACGQAYTDEFAQIRGAYEKTVRFYYAKGFEIRDNFMMEGFDAYPSCGIPSVWLIDMLSDEDDRFEECDWLLTRDASVVVAICDAGDPDQTDRLAALRLVCAEKKCRLRTLFYDSQDWSRFCQCEP